MPCPGPGDVPAQVLHFQKALLTGSISKFGISNDWIVAPLPSPLSVMQPAWPAGRSSSPRTTALLTLCKSAPPPRPAGPPHNRPSNRLLPHPSGSTRRRRQQDPDPSSNPAAAVSSSRREGVEPPGAPPPRHIDQQLQAVQGLDDAPPAGQGILPQGRRQGSLRLSSRREGRGSRSCCWWHPRRLCASQRRRDYDDDVSAATAAARDSTSAWLWNDARRLVRASCGTQEPTEGQSSGRWPGWSRWGRTPHVVVGSRGTSRRRRGLPLGRGPEADGLQWGDGWHFTLQGNGQIGKRQQQRRGGEFLRDQQRS